MFRPIELYAASITPTLDTNAYTSGNLLFDRVQIQNAVLNGKGFSYIRSVVTLDSANAKAAVDLLFFNKDPGSLGTINAAASLTAAQFAELVGMVSVATGHYTTLKANTNAIGQTLLNFQPLPAIATSKDLWVAGIARGTPTYLANSLTIKFMLERY